MKKALSGELTRRRRRPEGPNTRQYRSTSTVSTSSRGRDGRRSAGRDHVAPAPQPAAAPRRLPPPRSLRRGPGSQAAPAASSKGSLVAPMPGHGDRLPGEAGRRGQGGRRDPDPRGMRWRTAWRRRWTAWCRTSSAKGRQRRQGRSFVTIADPGRSSASRRRAGVSVLRFFVRPRNANGPSKSGGPESGTGPEGLQLFPGERVTWNASYGVLISGGIPRSGVLQVQLRIFLSNQPRNHSQPGARPGRRQASEALTDGRLVAARRQSLRALEQELDPPVARASLERLVRASGRLSAKPTATSLWPPHRSPPVAQGRRRRLRSVPSCWEAPAPDRDGVRVAEDVEVEVVLAQEGETRRGPSGRRT